MDKIIRWTLKHEDDFVIINEIYLWKFFFIFLDIKLDWSENSFIDFHFLDKPV